MPTKQRGSATKQSENLYSVSHEVEIGKRFKSHRLEVKGQSSNLKHVEKNDKMMNDNLTEKTLTFK